MKEQKKYVEPELKFNEITLDASIANTCWGYGNKPGDDPLYYDYTGKGYIRFSVGGGNCSGINADTYIEDIDFTNVPENERVQAESEFRNWFIEVSTNQPGGSPYNGDRFSEDTPGDWS